MDVDVLKRIVESSPVIVLVLGGACWVLWRKLDAKDQMVLELQRETLTAMGAITTAVHELKNALDNQR